MVNILNHHINDLDEKLDTVPDGYQDQINYAIDNVSP
jgi:hypothetical protein